MLIQTTTSKQIPVEHEVAGGLPTLSFALPAELEADKPPEARGLRRDEVRLKLASVDGGAVG